MRYTVILIPEDSGFSVLVPALPGCISMGRSRDEALTNARAAIAGWLETEAAEGRTPLPETAALIEAGVREALAIIDEMRGAGEVPAGQGYDLELATVQTPPSVPA
jgi:predicted RNase H-like HicB family nuclease